MAQKWKNLSFTDFSEIQVWHYHSQRKAVWCRIKYFAEIRNLQRNARDPGSNPDE